MSTFATVAQRNVATPFPSTQDPDNSPVSTSAPSTSMKGRPPMTESSSGTTHQNQDRVYVLVDPAYLQTLRASGAAVPLTASQSFDVTSSQNSPSNPLSPGNVTYVIRGDNASSRTPTTSTPAPPSSPSVISDPPPQYT